MKSLYRARYSVLLAMTAALTLYSPFTFGAGSPYDDIFGGTALDTKWTIDDINPAQAGGAAVKNGALIMTSYGSGDVNNDTALFVSQKLSGDFIATLKVLSVPQTGDDASAGLMVRQSNDPGAPMVYLFADMIDWREGTKMWARVNASDPRAEVARIRYYQLPVWLRIVRQGDAGSEFFIVEEGEVRTTVETPDGRALAFGPFGRGFFFGEMSLLTGEPRGATVTALADVTVLVVTKDRFADVLTANPRVAERLSVAVAKRKAEVAEGMAEGEALSAEGRYTRENILIRIKEFFNIK